ncbi:uncharacterized protein LOC130954980 isoform X2 [Arachis stenosperma]|uniref:uncharacterized protein LOC130954980 isoform X2 n=1 Tax=Arachis stenosperma TaxID=217475 RepID=UPI0025ABC1B7|nr:uncharacterized protein LOC130954980 isoform X2 [Arachis stenosperma]
MAKIEGSADRTGIKSVGRKRQTQQGLHNKRAKRQKAMEIMDPRQINHHHQMMMVMSNHQNLATSPNRSESQSHADDSAN